MSDCTRVSADDDRGGHRNSAADDDGFTINDAAPESLDEAVGRLGKLSGLEYDLVRKPEAKKLGVRVGTLDAAVARMRGDPGTSESGQGRPLHLPRPEPWPEPVNGAELIDGMANFLDGHVFLPAGAVDALAAWVLHTYCFALFRHTPRVAFTSPEKGCGKTTALDAIWLLACSPLSTANVTAAAVFRIVEMARPTLLIDEADTFLGDNEALRGLINAGHKQGGQAVRCVGEDAEPRQFSAFAPAAIAAIGRLPGTIEDRAINVRMRRATRAERRKPLDAKAEKEGKRLARMCERWVADFADKLAAAEPILPAALFNRSADNWRPLFAIADLAGGNWRERLIEASATLAPGDDDEGRGIRLLLDIRTIFSAHSADFPAHSADRIASAELCSALNAIETSPWSEMYNGRPITPASLARMLRPFNVRPNTKREGKETFKGYAKGDFLDAWARYAPEETLARGSENPSHRHKQQKSANSTSHDPSRTGEVVTDTKLSKPEYPAGCDGVTAAGAPSLPAALSEPATAETACEAALQPVVPGPARWKLRDYVRHAAHLRGVQAASLQRPPSWVGAQNEPSPGAWCTCCRGVRWWREREGASGWYCSTCYPADHLPREAVVEVQT